MLSHRYIVNHTRFPLSGTFARFACFVCSVLMHLMAHPNPVKTSSNTPAHRVLVRKGSLLPLIVSFRLQDPCYKLLFHKGEFTFQQFRL